MNLSSDKSSFPFVILIAGSIVVLISMGIRASLGLYLKPMSIDLGWGREIFAFAMAAQNLFWGALQPFAAAIAEKWGAGRVIAGGGILYAIGLYLMSISTDPYSFNFSAGLLLGMAQSGCGLAAVLGVVGRSLSDSSRPLGLGIVTAFAGAGQFFVVPIGQAFLTHYGWSISFVLLGLMSTIIIFTAYFLRVKQIEPPRPLMANSADSPEVPTAVSPEAKSIVTAIERRKPAENEAAALNLDLKDMLFLAARDKSYWLLTTGFFVCGFHVAFIAVHMPAYLDDKGLPADLGAYSLMLIALFNVFGSILAGFFGSRFPKKYLLTILYTLRAITILIFIMVPVTTSSVMLFSVMMGLLWLSTVPLTSGLVATIFGTRYMGTLFGIVFFSHQLGSFLGVWLGGYFFDATGSYELIWWAGIVLGFTAAILHWPIKEESRAEAQTA
tara:strand:+ start:104 stop:1426 length:1323 start_codon:yes stop_codon:yes gene_type:complete